MQHSAPSPLTHTLKPVVMSRLKPSCLHRLEVHQSTLAAAKAKLLGLMRDTPPDQLEQLLHSTFAYIGLVPLRDIFLAIVGRQV